VARCWYNISCTWSSLHSCRFEHYYYSRAQHQTRVCQTMSSMTPHQHNRFINDHSHHETSFGGYTNRGTHVHVSEGTINLVQANDHDNPSKPLRMSQDLFSILFYLTINQRDYENTVHLGPLSTLENASILHNVLQLLGLKLFDESSSGSMTMDSDRTRCQQALFGCMAVLG